jgi:c-di-AMP phosphodiesterase-like protein
MTKLAENQEYKLTVTFLHKTRVSGGKIIRVTESDHKYCYYGKTKREAIKKAKSRFHFGSSYKIEWDIVED